MGFVPYAFASDSVGFVPTELVIEKTLLITKPFVYIFFVFLVLLSESQHKPDSGDK